MLNVFNLKMALGYLHILFYKVLPITPVEFVSSTVLLSDTILITINCCFKNTPPAVVSLLLQAFVS